MTLSQKIVVTQIGESFRHCTEIVSEELPDPVANQVLVRHHYAGVNGVYDQMLCANRVDLRPTVLPADTGVEAIGVVAAVGPEVTNFRPGDAVASFGAGSGYCEYKIVDAGKLIDVPRATPEVLALIPSGVSALVALERTGEMTTGETICITAAAGGFGNVATQLAVNAGNHVVAVCGSERKAQWLRSVGVHRVVNYRRENLAEVLAAEYPDRINLALDSVAGETFDTLLDQLAPHGRLVSCGQTTDRLPPEQVTSERVYTKLYWKAASVRGFMNLLFHQYGPDARRRLLAMVDQGSVTPLLDDVEFKGLEQVADAGEHLLAGDNMGKVLVDLRA